MVQNFIHKMKKVSYLHPFVKIFLMSITMVMIGLLSSLGIRTILIKTGVLILLVYLSIFAVWLNDKLK